MQGRIFDLIIAALLVLNLFITLNLWVEVEEMRNLLNLGPTFNFALPSHLWIFSLLCLISFLILIILKQKRKQAKIFII
jgi:hypothetical protein